MSDIKLNVPDMGRKPKKQLSNTRIFIRISDKQKDSLIKDAAKQGLNISSYVKHLLHTHPSRK